LKHSLPKNEGGLQRRFSFSSFINKCPSQLILVFLDQVGVASSDVLKNTEDSLAEKITPTRRSGRQKKVF
jgi:hypothetical protein